MRVIAGTAKGRRLRSPDRSGVRPTTDRVKEALFSTLGPGIAGKRVVDLYAGSGALGIEALSRGAGSATFVERDPIAVASIEENLRAAGLEEGAEVVHMQVEHFALQAKGAGYEVVFADPPYNSGLPAALLEELAQGGVLGRGATLVVEVSFRLQSPSLPVGYRLLERRRYGDSALVYLRYEPGESTTEVR